MTLKATETAKREGTAVGKIGCKPSTFFQNITLTRNKNNVAPDSCELLSCKWTDPNKNEKQKQ